MTFSSYLTLKDSDVDVEVEYRFHPGHRGARDSLGGKRGAGPPLEPDEPAECEIERVTLLERNLDLDLDEISEKDFERLCNEADEHYMDYIVEAQADREPDLPPLEDY